MKSANIRSFSINKHGLEALHTRGRHGSWAPAENGFPAPEYGAVGHVTIVSFLPSDLVMFSSFLFALWNQLLLTVVANSKHIANIHVQEVVSRLLLMFFLSGYTGVGTFLEVGSLFPHSPCLYFTAIAMPLSHINKLLVLSGDFKLLKVAIPSFRL